jgi:hypothetical protein
VVPESPDLFGSFELLRVLHAFGISTDTLVTFPQGDYLVELRKGSGFQARGWDEMGFAEAPKGLFLGPFVLSVWRHP